MKFFITHDLWPADIAVVIVMGLMEAAFVLTLIKFSGIMSFL